MTGPVVRRALAAGGIVLGVAVLSAGVASADGPVQLKSRLGDFCLDAPSFWDAPLVINPCNGSDSQRWNFTADGLLESVADPGQCVAVPRDQWWAHLLPYCARSIDTDWTLRPNGQIATDYGACLAVLGGPTPGAWVRPLDCSDAPDREWDSVP